ncbi:MAG: GspE/PulE family protein, partial [Armatimonadaceae bacterium]
MQLIDTLADRGILSEAERAKALDAVTAAADRPPHLTLLEKGFVKEEALFPALADEFGMQYVDLTQATVEAAALEGIPQKLVHKKNLMPLSRNNGTLVVATGDPFDSYALDELQTITGLQIHPVLGSPREIARLLKTHFGIGGDNVAGLMATAKKDDDVELLENIEADDSEAAKQAQEATVVGLVNKILIEAASERASDVHIEHEETGIVIRYRIDGLLQLQRLPPEINRWSAAIVSRLKIMAELDIAEKRLPQDGRISLRIGGKAIDVRVSTLPSAHGERAVLRLLDKTDAKFSLKNLGMSGAVLAGFEGLIRQPHGIVLVTGPTGSGKTTTL